jgi:hypothetical protein
MAQNIALTDNSPVHRDNGEGQPICGSGAVATKPFKKTRKHITCNKCRGIVKDMDAKAEARVAEAIKADSVAMDTPRTTRVMGTETGQTVTVEEVTEVGKFMVTFEYTQQRIVIENINAVDWQEAVSLASDMLIATAARTQYWIAQPTRTV